MLVLILFAALLVLPSATTAQCCGDCNGDGEVAINELITAVNNALGQCTASGACPIDFRDDNLEPGTADCFYVGRWNPTCGAADLASLWRSDGEIVIVEMLGFEAALFFVGAEVTGTNSADIIGWFRKEDASDLQELGGTITLGTNGATLAIDPNTPPVDIDGDCPFTAYRGSLDEVLVPEVATAAARLRAISSAALARLRAAAHARPRPQLRRR